MNDELIIESLLFVLSQPLKQSDLKKVFDNGNTPSLDDIVEKLNQKYTDHAFQISKIGGGYMLVSKKDFEPFISKILSGKNLIECWFRSISYHCL